MSSNIIWNYVTNKTSCCQTKTCALHVVLTRTIMRIHCFSRVPILFCESAMIFKKDKYRRKGRSVYTGNNQYFYIDSESHVKVVAHSDKPTQIYHSTLYFPPTLRSIIMLHANCFGFPALSFTVYNIVRPCRQLFGANNARAHYTLPAQHQTAVRRS